MAEGSEAPTRRAEPWAAAARRATGVALLLVVLVLAFETFLLAYNDVRLYDSVAGFWRTPAGRWTAVVLVGALAFHGADHLRVALARAAPRFAPRALFAVELVVVAGSFVAAVLLTRPGPGVAP